MSFIVIGKAGEQSITVYLIVPLPCRDTHSIYGSRIPRFEVSVVYTARLTRILILSSHLYPRYSFMIYDCNNRREHNRAQSL